MDKGIVRVGLIGLGNMGQNHLRVLSMLKKVDLAFVYDADTKKAELLAAQHGTKACIDLKVAFKSPVDSIVICTPTSTHASYIRQASQHVKNIFVEKPMAVSGQEALEISVLVRERALNLQVGFIERFNPAVQQLKHVLDNSNGVVNIDFTRTNKLSARITDVDVISDLMIHDIDLALHINGPVSSISAQGTFDKGVQLVGFASAILTHTNGRFSRIMASRITEKKMRKIEATCNGIFVDCELVRKEILISRQSEMQHREGAFRISALQEAVEVKPQEALLLEMQSFIESCLGSQSATNPTVEDGVAAISVAEDIRGRILAA